MTAQIAPQRSANAQPPAGGAVITRLLPEYALKMSNEWIVRGACLPHGINVNPIAGHAHVKTVMLAFATVSSDYWQQSLGGRALCVRRGDGVVVCRVSSMRDGHLEPLISDAVIWLADNEPGAYTTMLSATLPIKDDVDAFCSRAIEAALLPMHGLVTWPPTVVRNAVDQHKTGLKESISKSIIDHASELKQLTPHILRGPAAT
ncbi:MAG TPA: hypothetical protein VK519_05100 [Pinirhizobacter sp.]|uniref:hypothetical protein n=1 Tax=Pinirhizobacter sp. TaxID=2950432 RepID=UPI002BAEF2AE|nr:hypothetical protein [Pinirhizobacter sp.]HMH67280.1 hypothetical protein [Pinirhizobacter sp.]